MKQRMIPFVTAMLAALLTTTAAWADTSPIGTLKAQGKVTIEAPSSTFTLTDQEYAYFSGDAITTSPGAQAEVTLNDGLTITFIGDAAGSVSRNDGVYDIEIRQGPILVDAATGVGYRISHNGAPVSPDQALEPSNKPFVVSVAEAGEVQFYMPAQLDDEDEAAGGLLDSGLSATQIAAIIAAITGAVIIVSDDDGPSS